MLNRRYLLILIFTSLILSGCIQNTVPAIDLYTINIPCGIDKPIVKKAAAGTVLKVSIPKSTSSIMSRNILYQKDEYSQNPYAHSNWNDTPNIMLGRVFLSCINKSSIFQSVLPSYSKGKSDFLLESNLMEFYHHINTDGSSEGRVKVEFYLIDLKSGNVISTNEFFSKVSSKTLDAKGGVKALNYATKSIANSLVRWLKSLEKLSPI